MIDKIEKISNIALNCFLIITLVLVCFKINNVSMYTADEHLAEMGEVPVYMSKEEALQSVQVNTEVEAPDLTTYMSVSYDNILKYCTNIDSEKILIEGTVYSVMKTSTAYTYNIADRDGNYYNIIDETSKFPKYNKADVLLIYGVPYGIAKLNGAEIPSMKVNYIELVEK